MKNNLIILLISGFFLASCSDINLPNLGVSKSSKPEITPHKSHFDRDARHGTSDLLSTVINPNHSKDKDENENNNKNDSENKNTEIVSYKKSLWDATYDVLNNIGISSYSKESITTKYFQSSKDMKFQIIANFAEAGNNNLYNLDLEVKKMTRRNKNWVLTSNNDNIKYQIIDLIRRKQQE